MSFDWKTGLWAGAGALVGGFVGALAGEAIGGDKAAGYSSLGGVFLGATLAGGLSASKYEAAAAGTGAAGAFFQDGPPQLPERTV